MNLINKNSKQIVSIEEYKVTEYPYNEWYVYTNSLLEFNPEYVIDFIFNYSNYNVKYRICDSLIFMTQAQIKEFEAAKQIQKELEEHISSFNGFRFKVTSSASIMQYTSPFRGVFEIGLAENNPRQLIYDEDGNLTHIISFWNEIKSNFRSIIESNIDTFKLEENPIYGEVI